MEGAFAQPQKSVLLEFLAFGAQFASVGAVVSFAVEFHHVCDGFSFAFHAFMFWVGWLRLHCGSILEGAFCHIRICPYLYGFLGGNNPLYKVPDTTETAYFTETKLLPLT